MYNGYRTSEAFQPIEILWWGLSVLGLSLGVCIMVITGGNMHKPGDDPGHAGYGWKEEERMSGNNSGLACYFNFPCK